MPRWLFYTILLATCVNLAGCAADREDREVDQLWRDGYGYRNPNPERAKRGQPLLNFDGTEYRP